MKSLFEMPFVFSYLIEPNEGFRRAFLEMCNQEYEPPKVIVINRREEDSVFGKEVWVDIVFSDGILCPKFIHHIRNVPTEKEIAKNKKMYDFWKSTIQQLQNSTLPN